MLPFGGARICQAEELGGVKSTRSERGAHVGRRTGDSPRLGPGFGGQRSETRLKREAGLDGGLRRLRSSRVYLERLTSGNHARDCRHRTCVLAKSRWRRHGEWVGVKAEDGTSRPPGLVLYPL